MILMNKDIRPIQGESTLVYVAEVYMSVSSNYVENKTLTGVV